VEIRAKLRCAGQAFQQSKLLSTIETPHRGYIGSNSLFLKPAFAGFDEVLHLILGSKVSSLEEREGRPKGCLKLPLQRVDQGSGPNTGPNPGREIAVAKVEALKNQLEALRFPI
jgi:hypothetical protein